METRIRRCPICRRCIYIIYMSYLSTSLNLEVALLLRTMLLTNHRQRLRVQSQTHSLLFFFCPPSQWPQQVVSPNLCSYISHIACRLFFYSRLSIAPNFDTANRWHGLKSLSSTLVFYQQKLSRLLVYPGAIQRYKPCLCCSITLEIWLSSTRTTPFEQRFHRSYLAHTMAPSRLDSRYPAEQYYCSWHTLSKLYRRLGDPGWYHFACPMWSRRTATFLSHGMLQSR